MMMLLGANWVNAQLYSNLTFFTPQGERFQVVINGKLQNLDPETSVKIEHIEEEYVASKIIFEASRLSFLFSKRTEMYLISACAFFRICDCASTKAF